MGCSCQGRIIEGLKKGHLEFVLDGHQLKGAFALIRMGASDSKNWLLCKIKDEYTSKKDVTQNIQSVLSKRSIPNKVK